MDHRCEYTYTQLYFISTISRERNDLIESDSDLIEFINLSSGGTAMGHDERENGADGVGRGRRGRERGEAGKSFVSRNEVTTKSSRLSHG